MGQTRPYLDEAMDTVIYYLMQMHITEIIFNYQHIL